VIADETGKERKFQNVIVHHSGELEDILEGKFNFSYLDLLTECNNTGIASWTSDLKILVINFGRLKRYMFRREGKSCLRKVPDGPLNAGETREFLKGFIGLRNREYLHSGKQLRIYLTAWNTELAKTQT